MESGEHVAKLEISNPCTHFTCQGTIVAFHYQIQAMARIPREAVLPMCGELLICVENQQFATHK
jgi:hypothetical protein